MKKRLLLSATLFTGVGGVLACHAAYYYPFLSDDALISLRYAQRLIRGFGLTWTDGERVEGYTNFLWVLINAALGFLGIDLITSARSVAFMGALGAIYMVSLTPGFLFRLDPVRLLTGGLILALCAPLAVWSIGALEHGLMAGLLAGALVLLSRSFESPISRGSRMLPAGLLFALLALLRADGILLFCSALLGALASRGISARSLKDLFVLSILPALLLSLQVIFRIIYYNEFLPNTAYAKVSFTWARVEMGLSHVARGFYAVGVLCALVLLALFWFFKSGAFARRRHRLLIPLCVSITWTAYLVVIGGDIFPGWRQLLISIVPLTLIVTDAASGIAAEIKRYRFVLALCWVGLLCGYFVMQTFDSENQRAKAERWEWGGYPVGTLLKRAFSKHRPLLAVDAGGALPYWSELPSLDMLGLNDAHIAKHPPASFGRGQIGHELGDGGYVWRRKPDIIAFNNAVGAREPRFISGKQLMANRAFAKSYQFVKLQGVGGNRAIGELYFRYQDGPLGIQRASDMLRIPGYLFSGTTPTGARLESDGGLVTPITHQHPGRIENVYLKKGAWRLLVRPDAPRARAAFLCNHRSAGAMSSERASRAVFLPTLRVKRPTYVDIIIAREITGEESLRLREVSLERVSKTEATHVCESFFAPQRVELGEISFRKDPGTSWLYPGNTILSQRGVIVTLPRTMHPVRLEISADNNDTYQIQYLSDDSIVATNHFGPSPGRGGLAIYRVEAPFIVVSKGINALMIRPVSGDGSYSIGHLSISE
ncbi:MAG: hypothetical protein JXA30_15620 [Deltaproteobacteria bacterium]|nr:hypothetical protein [Deltaproteobacteria bacterium]